jgi:ABC-type iron transport system FetAB ATPase subunit
MTEASRSLLSVEGLRSAHGGPFDLCLERGECIAVVGRSGSGKSVLLRLLADLDPGAGLVELEGRQRESWSAPEWRSRVIYQAAEPAWWKPSVAEHFRPGDRPLLDRLMPALDLPAKLLDAEVARLSTGERQRFALLRSLSRQPAVLLLDEPSAALDTESTLAMEALLRERLAAGLAIVLVTHSREQAGRIANRTFEMSERRLKPLLPPPLPSLLQ